MNGGPDIIRKTMPYANKEMIEQFLASGNTDLLKYGGDILQSAAFHGKADIVDLLVDRGANIHIPPETIQGDDAYRKTPHVITASISGDVPTLDAVLRAGG